MVTIQCDDFDIRKIMASGQCFRMSENTLSYRENADRYIELIAFGKPLRVKQDGNMLSFSCSEEEFNQIWRQYFDLDTDYSNIIREAQEKYADDPYLMSAIDFSRGIRILKQDFFETLISFIISQRKSIFQIRKSVGTLSYRNGCQMAANGFDGERYSLTRFPYANEIIQMAESGTLRSCTLGYRERYVYEASKWYATIWEVKPISDKLVKARVSISRKNKETNTYEAEFEDYVVFSGSVAAKNAMGLHEKDRIQIGDCDVRNKYDHEKKIKYYNFMIFSFDMANGGATIPAVDDTSPQPDVDSGEIDDSRLPF